MSPGPRPSHPWARPFALMRLGQGLWALPAGPGLAGHWIAGKSPQTHSRENVSGPVTSPGVTALVTPSTDEGSDLAPGLGCPAPPRALLPSPWPRPQPRSAPPPSRSLCGSRCDEADSPSCVYRLALFQDWVALVSDSPDPEHLDRGPRLPLWRLPEPRLQSNTWEWGGDPCLGPKATSCL